MPRATTFILVRHAQSTGNLSTGILMGGATDLPLTERGWIEARQLAGRLRGEPPPVAIYSSPLQRAVQTAEVLREHLSIERIVLAPDLREIACGDVDGWPIHRVQAVYPEVWVNNSQQTDPDFRWPGGESYREFRERLLSAMQSIAQQHPAQRAMIVTHAGVIGQLMGWIRGDSPARWEALRPRNASVTELSWREARVEVVRFDDHGGPGR